MALLPAPSNCGGITLQPCYFTSSIYVTALRDDIATLILRFRYEYNQNPSALPFPLFKKIWCLQGWHWLHFKIFDNRSRLKFLEITCRLFLEKTVISENPFTRVVAFLGLFTFFWTQPKDTAPSLYSLDHLPISTDHFNDLTAITRALNTPDLVPFQPTVIFLLSTFIDKEIFIILPKSDLFPLNPRDLPRETYVEEEGFDVLEIIPTKKKGRPSKRDRFKKAKATAESLDNWLAKTAGMALSTTNEILPDCSDVTHILSGTPATASVDDYQLHKSRLLETIGNTAQGCAAIERANELVLRRLTEARDLLPLESGPSPNARVSGLERIENVIEDLNKGLGLNRGGVLRLLEGAGLR